MEDLELRRQDEAYLNLLGAERIPDPTTAGDFYRRFQRQHLTALQETRANCHKMMGSAQGVAIPHPVSTNKSVGFFAISALPLKPSRHP